MQIIDSITVRYAEKSDINFWFSLDAHLSQTEFLKKVRDRQSYIIKKKEKPIGLLRYNLFWDNTPFCTLLAILPAFRRQGNGTKLMSKWEEDMKKIGYSQLLLSTRADETSQHFYRKLNYVDCGSMILPDQPTELFFRKFI